MSLNEWMRDCGDWCFCECCGLSQHACYRYLLALEPDIRYANTEILLETVDSHVFHFPELLESEYSSRLLRYSFWLILFLSLFFPSAILGTDLYEYFTLPTVVHLPSFHLPYFAVLQSLFFLWGIMGVFLSVIFLCRDSSAAPKKQVDPSPRVYLAIHSVVIMLLLLARRLYAAPTFIFSLVMTLATLTQSFLFSFFYFLFFLFLSFFFDLFLSYPLAQDSWNWVNPNTTSPVTFGSVNVSSNALSPLSFGLSSSERSMLCVANLIETSVVVILVSFFAGRLISFLLRRHFFVRVVTSDLAARVISETKRSQSIHRNFLPLPPASPGSASSVTIPSLPKSKSEGTGRSGPSVLVGFVQVLGSYGSGGSGVSLLREAEAEAEAEVRADDLTGEKGEVERRMIQRARIHDQPPPVELLPVLDEVFSSLDDGFRVMEERVEEDEGGEFRIRFSRLGTHRNIYAFAINLFISEESNVTARQLEEKFVPFVLSCLALPLDDAKLRASLVSIPSSELLVGPLSIPSESPTSHDVSFAVALVHPLVAQAKEGLREVAVGEVRLLVEAGRGEIQRMMKLFTNMDLTVQFVEPWEEVNDAGEVLYEFPPSISITRFSSPAAFGAYLKQLSDLSAKTDITEDSSKEEQEEEVELVDQGGEFEMERVFRRTNREELVSEMFRHYRAREEDRDDYLDSEARARRRLERKIESNEDKKKLLVWMAERGDQEAVRILAESGTVDGAAFAVSEVMDVGGLTVEDYERLTSRFEAAKFLHHHRPKVLFEASLPAMTKEDISVLANVSVFSMGSCFGKGGCFSSNVFFANRHSQRDRYTATNFIVLAFLLTLLIVRSMGDASYQFMGFSSGEPFSVAPLIEVFTPTTSACFVAIFAAILLSFITHAAVVASSCCESARKKPKCGCLVFTLSWSVSFLLLLSAATTHAIVNVAYLRDPTDSRLWGPPTAYLRVSFLLLPLLGGMTFPAKSVFMTLSYAVMYGLSLALAGCFVLDLVTPLFLLSGILVSYVFARLDLSVFQLAVLSRLHLKKFRQQMDRVDLLLQLLTPDSVRQDVAENGINVIVSDYHPRICMFYADVCHLTTGWANHIGAEEFFEEYSAFYRCVEAARLAFRLDRIKHFLGTVYHVISPLEYFEEDVEFENRFPFSLRLVELALAFKEAVMDLPIRSQDCPVVARVGLHIGDLLGGITGVRTQVSFDVFGYDDLVGQALMELAPANTILVSTALKIELDRAGRRMNPFYRFSAPQLETHILLGLDSVEFVEVERPLKPVRKGRKNRRKKNFGSLRRRERRFQEARARYREEISKFVDLDGSGGEEKDGEEDDDGEGDGELDVEEREENVD